MKADLRRSGLLGAGVAVAVVIIAATSAGGHQDATSSDYSAPRPAATTPPTANQAFLADLEANDPEATSEGDTMTIRLGHDVCTDFANGFSAQNVMEDAASAAGTVDSTLSDDDMGAIVAAAVTDLCTQYKPQIEAWRQANGFTG